MARRNQTMERMDEEKKTYPGQKRKIFSISCKSY